MTEPANVPRLSLRKKLFFSLCVFVAVLLLLEVGLRLAWDRAPRFLGERLRETKLFVKDPVVGWRMRPNQSIVLKWHWGDTTKITTNSAGYRGPEHSTEREANRQRVLVLGDSHAFGYGVDDAEVLSERLREQRPDLDVLNFAVSGYNVAQCRAVLETDGRRYHPDTVVLFFTQDDVMSQVISQDSASRRREGGFKQFMGDHSYLYDFVRTKVNSNRGLARLFVRIGLKDKRTGHLSGHLRTYLKRYPESLARDWDETMREIAEVKRICDGIPACLVLMIVPARESVQHEALLSTLSYTDYVPEDFDLDKPYRALAASCEPMGVVVLDPSERLREADARGPSPYFEHDIHINAEGHRILAGILESALAR